MDKTCTRCGETKPYSAFHKKRSSPDGHRPHCKTCRTRDRDLEREQAYREKNRETLRAGYRRYHSAHREERLEDQRNYYQRNKADFIRRAKERQRHVNERATPAWADHEAIREFYRQCPEGYHVDHIVPLKGETVSGLHVLENLQWLPAAENLAKGNQWLNH